MIYTPKTPKGKEKKVGNRLVYRSDKMGIVENNWDIILGLDYGECEVLGIDEIPFCGYKIVLFGTLDGSEHLLGFHSGFAFDFSRGGIYLPATLVS